MDEKTESRRERIELHRGQKRPRMWRKGRNGGRIQTRFPPEPNGYLHISHARLSAWTSASPRNSMESATSVSMTPTPSKEDVEYVDSIKEDIQWLGYQVKTSTTLPIISSNCGT